MEKWCGSGWICEGQNWEFVDFFFVSCVWCNLCFEGIMRDFEADLWLVGADLSMGFAFRMFFL